MEISLRFAELRVNNEIYNKDVIILYNGKVIRRPKDLSRPKSDKYNHTPFSLEEAEEVIRLLGESIDYLVIGTGINGRMVVEEGVKEIFEKQGIKIEIYKSEEAIQRFLSLIREGKKVGLLVHVTC